MNVAIFGVGVVAELIYKDIVKNTKDKVILFVTDNPKDGYFMGLPHISFEQYKSKYNFDDIFFFVAIGPSNMNDNRLNVYYRLKNCGAMFYNYKSPFAIYDGPMNDNVYIGNFSSIHDNVTIGVGTLIWDQVNISHDSELKEFIYISPNTSVGSYVTIENNALLGMGSIIKPKIVIATRSLIGAGSYISNSTVENGVYSPVKVNFYGQISTKINIS